MQSQAKHTEQVIDVFESWQVNGCAMMLGVSVETLLDAIAIVGNDFNAVEEYLRTRRIYRQHY